MSADAEQARLAALRSYQLLDTPSDRHLDAIVYQAAANLDAPIASITLIDEHRQWFKASVGLDATETPLDDSICVHAIRSDRPLVVPDAQVDERFRRFASVEGEPGVRFYAGVPLRMRDGARLGTLCVIDTEARDGLADDERVLLAELARRVVAAFELHRDMLHDARGGGPSDDGDWLTIAEALLARASVALERAGATAPVARVAEVLAEVEALRRWY